MENVANKRNSHPRLQDHDRHLRLEPSAIHEFNNVLAVICNSGELASRALTRVDDRSPEVNSAIADLERILDASAHGVTLVRDLPLAPDDLLPYAEASAQPFAEEGIERPPPGTDSASEPDASRAATRVLFVDDERAICDMAVRMLRGHGLRVSVAQDAAQALTLLETSPFDVLVTDLRMPGLSGTALARKAVAMHTGIRVVLISGGYVDDDLTDLGPAVRVLEKPFRRSELIDAVVAHPETHAGSRS